jgi:lipopolysaccharide/colanic/teichoic acid biosynthesis glycosyltransferase
MYQPAGGLVDTAFLPSRDVGFIPLSYRQPTHWPIHGWRAAVKRTMDISIALILLAAFAVLLLATMLLIRLETPGRALFCQRRVGFANVGFDMWKLRTMYEHPPGQGRLVQATRDDPRVTPFGRWLRRTSLDELPQLFNVLRGDMSLVGPRPHALGTCVGDKPFEMVTPHYFARHRVRPGITGLAQVRGLRGETETEQKLLQRIAADLEYIEHWSLWLDLKILLRTIAALFSAQNAY